MKLPIMPQRGRPITTEWAQAVVRCLNSLYPRPSADVLPTVGGRGTTYRLKRGGSSGGSGDTDAGLVDFQLIDDTSSTGSPPTYTQQVRVVLGIVTDTSPGGTAWIPTGMTLGDAKANWCILPVSGTGFVYIPISYDTTSGNVTAVGNPVAANTVPANSAGLLNLSLGTYDATASTSAVAVTGAIGDVSVFMCGTTLLPGGVGSGT